MKLCRGCGTINQMASPACIACKGTEFTNTTVKLCSSCGELNIGARASCVNCSKSLGVADKEITSPRELQQHMLLNKKRKQATTKIPSPRPAKSKDASKVIEEQRTRLEERLAESKRRRELAALQASEFKSAQDRVAALSANRDKAKPNEGKAKADMQARIARVRAEQEAKLRDASNPKPRADVTRGDGRESIAELRKKLERDREERLAQQERERADLLRAREEEKAKADEEIRQLRENLDKERAERQAQEQNLLRQKEEFEAAAAKAKEEDLAALREGFERDMANMQEQERAKHEGELAALKQRLEDEKKERQDLEVAKQENQKAEAQQDYQAQIDALKQRLEEEKKEREDAGLTPHSNEYVDEQIAQLKNTLDEELAKKDEQAKKEQEKFEKAEKERFDDEIKAFYDKAAADRQEREKEAERKAMQEAAERQAMQAAADRQAAANATDAHTGATQQDTQTGATQQDAQGSSMGAQDTNTQQGADNAQGSATGASQDSASHTDSGVGSTDQSAQAGQHTAGQHTDGQTTDQQTDQVAAAQQANTQPGVITANKPHSAMSSDMSRGLNSDLNLQTKDFTADSNNSEIGVDTNFSGGSDLRDLGSAGQALDNQTAQLQRQGIENKAEQLREMAKQKEQELADLQKQKEAEYNQQLANIEANLKSKLADIDTSKAAYETQNALAESAVAKAKQDAQQAVQKAAHSKDQLENLNKQFASTPNSADKAELDKRIAEANQQALDDARASREAEKAILGAEIAQKQAALQLDAANQQANIQGDTARKLASLQQEALQSDIANQINDKQFEAREHILTQQIELAKKANDPASLANLEQNLAATNADKQRRDTENKQKESDITQRETALLTQNDTQLKNLEALLEQNKATLDARAKQEDAQRDNLYANQLRQLYDQIISEDKKRNDNYNSARQLEGLEPQNLNTKPATVTTEFAPASSFVEGSQPLISQMGATSHLGGAATLNEPSAQQAVGQQPQPLHSSDNSIAKQSAKDIYERRLADEARAEYERKLKEAELANKELALKNEIVARESQLELQAQARALEAQRVINSLSDKAGILSLEIDDFLKKLEAERAATIEVSEGDKAQHTGYTRAQKESDIKAFDANMQLLDEQIRQAQLNVQENAANKAHLDTARKGLDEFKRDVSKLIKEIAEHHEAFNEKPKDESVRHRYSQSVNALANYIKENDTKFKEAITADLDILGLSSDVYANKIKQLIAQVDDLQNTLKANEPQLQKAIADFDGIVTDFNKLEEDKHDAIAKMVKLRGDFANAQSLTAADLDRARAEVKAKEKEELEKLDTDARATEARLTDELKAIDMQLTAAKTQKNMIVQPATIESDIVRLEKYQKDILNAGEDVRSKEKAYMDKLAEREAARADAANKRSDIRISYANELANAEREWSTAQGSKLDTEVTSMEQIKKQIIDIYTNGNARIKSGGEKQNSIITMQSTAEVIHHKTQGLVNKINELYPQLAKAFDQKHSIAHQAQGAFAQEICKVSAESAKTLNNLMETASTKLLMADTADKFELEQSQQEMLKELALKPITPIVYKVGDKFVAHQFGAAPIAHTHVEISERERARLEKLKLKEDKKLAKLEAKEAKRRAKLGLDDEDIKVKDKKRVVAHDMIDYYDGLDFSRTAAVIASVILMTIGLIALLMPASILPVLNGDVSVSGLEAIRSFTNSANLTSGGAGDGTFAHIADRLRSGGYGWEHAGAILLGQLILIFMIFALVNIGIDVLCLLTNTPRTMKTNVIRFIVMLVLSLSILLTAVILTDALSGINLLTRYGAAVPTPHSVGGILWVLPIISVLALAMGIYSSTTRAAGFKADREIPDELYA
ncbi:MAG: hypothetical protein FWB72_02425 [Firmicutes bacterium]|nr:hypothetical protein [Bacillota bacterium]